MSNIFSKFNGRVYETQVTVPAGQSKIIYTSGSREASLAVHPGANTTANVFISLSPKQAVEAGLGLWVVAEIGNLGVVTAPDSQWIPAPITAIKVESIGGDTVVESLQH